MFIVTEPSGGGGGIAVVMEASVEDDVVDLVDEVKEACSRISCFIFSIYSICLSMR